MKAIAKLYLDYMERTAISLVLASLVLTAISGFAYGGRGWVPATLSVVTLGLIVYVAIGRRRVLREHPEFKQKPFEEIRLFLYLLQRKVADKADFSHLNSKKQRIQQTVGRGLAILIAALAIVTLWSSFSISADIAALKKNEELKNNQVIAGARPGIPATFFNSAVVIEVLEVSNGSGTSPKVTALITSEGYPDLKIESAGLGYETFYNGPNRFRIRIMGFDNITVQFFVERLTDYPA